jgi:putative tricarboxylic transport membrane protein
MRKANLIIALVFEGIGVWIIIESCRLGIKTLNDPGAGFFPLILAILLCLLGLPVIISSLKNFGSADVRKEPEEIKYTTFKKIGAVIGSLIGYAVFLNILGSLLTFFLLLWGLFWMGSPRRWLFVSGLSALVAALSYLLFVILLQVPFPAGVWR